MNIGDIIVYSGDKPEWNTISMEWTLLALLYKLDLSDHNPYDSQTGYYPYRTIMYPAANTVILGWV